MPKKKPVTGRRVITNIVIAKNQQPVHYPMLYRHSDKKSFCLVIPAMNVRRFVWDSIQMAVSDWEPSQAERIRQAAVYSRWGLDDYDCVIGVETDGVMKAYSNFTYQLCDDCWRELTSQAIEDLVTGADGPGKRARGRRREWRSSLSYSEAEIKNLNRTVWVQRALRGRGPLLFLELERMRSAMIAQVEAHQENQLALVCAEFPGELRVVEGGE